MTPSPRPPAAPWRTLAILAVALGAAAGGAVLAYRRAQAPTAPATTLAAVLPVPRPLPAVSLVAQDGTRFDTEQFAGHYTLVLFGYTSCPDVCPTTLLELARLRRLLADLGADAPRIALVSVDPRRDTPARLAAYVAHFDPSFVGLSGSEASLATLERALGVVVVTRPGSAGAYAVEHTAALFLIDRAARVAAVFPAPHVAAAIAADYRRIVAAAGRA